MTNNNAITRVWTKPFYREIEYQMPTAFAKSLLASRKGTDKNMDPQKYLCQLVNTEFGIKGNCTKVTLN